LISPPFTTAIAMIFSLGPRGLITHDLLGISNFSVYGLHSTLFSETITLFPIAYLTLKAILAGIDPTVEDMAFSLGSSRWRVFRTVTLPLTIPGIANAFLSRQTMEIVSMINYALPGTIVGIAYLLVFNDPPLMLAGTAVIIIACYVFRYGPTGIRTTVAILQQIDPSIEEASFRRLSLLGRTFQLAAPPDGLAIGRKIQVFIRPETVTLTRKTGADLLSGVEAERTFLGVKAAGGIRTLADALAMIEAGASRIGASASVAILNELET